MACTSASSPSANANSWCSIPCSCFDFARASSVAFEVISLNLDALLKRLREGGAWAGNGVQDSLFAGSVSSDRALECTCSPRTRARGARGRDVSLPFTSGLLRGSGSPGFAGTARIRAAHVSPWPCSSDWCAHRVRRKVPTDAQMRTGCSR